jgi:hypothetical protein
MRKSRRILPCLECGSTERRLSDGREAYPHRSDLFSKQFWFCGCGAFVGCHPGSDVPLGAPAGKATKRARMDAHAAFDALWKSRRMGRGEAYRWLADKLGIAPRDCHIGHMTRDMAERVVSVSREEASA